MTRCARSQASHSAGRLAFLCALVAALVALPALGWADDDEEPRDIGLEEFQEESLETWGRLGPYVGMGGVGTFINAKELHEGVDLDSGAGSGFNVRLGLRTVRWFAFEVMYEQLMSIPVSRGGQDEDAKGWFWSLNGKGYFIHNAPIQPYLLVGAGALSIQPRIISRRTGFAMRFMGGVDFHVTKHIVIDVEAGYAQGLGTQVENFGYGVVSSGITYRF